MFIMQKTRGLNNSITLILVVVVIAVAVAVINQQSAIEDIADSVDELRDMIGGVRTAPPGAGDSAGDTIFCLDTDRGDKPGTAGAAVEVTVPLSLVFRDDFFSEGTEIISVESIGPGAIKIVFKRGESKSDGLIIIKPDYAIVESVPDISEPGVINTIVYHDEKIASSDTNSFPGLSGSALFNVAWSGNCETKTHMLTKTGNVQVIDYITFRTKNGPVPIRLFGDETNPLVFGNSIKLEFSAAASS